MKGKITRVSMGVALVAAVAVSPLRGQDILTNLTRLAEENARLYVAPISTGLGSALSSGFHQTAKSHDLFGFDIGLRLTAALPPGEAEFFQPVLPGSVTYEDVAYTNPFEIVGNGTSPTAVGEGAGAVLQPRPGSTFHDALLAAGETPSDFQVQFPSGANIPAVPFVVVQGSVGVGFGTEVTLRYLPDFNVQSDVGELSAFGFGLKHSLTHWLPSPPAVDVAVTASWQDMAIGRYLDATASGFGVISSVSQGPLTLYGIMRREKATVDVSYTVDNQIGDLTLPIDGVRIDFTNELPSQTLFGAGVTVNLVGLELSGEYSFANYSTVGVKIGYSMN